MAAEEWNQRVLRDSEAAAVALKLQQRMLASGVTYRFNEMRVARLRGKIGDWSPNDLSRQVPGRNGASYLEVPFEIALRPALITLEQADQLDALGRQLVVAIESAEELLCRDQQVAGTIIRTPRSEGSGLGVKPAHRRLAPWIRTDYIWSNQDGRKVPVVVDVNLLPGATFLTDSHGRIFEEDVVSRYANGKTPQRVFRTDVLNRHILEELAAWHGRDINNVRLAFVVREGHGLVPEMRLWVAAMTAGGVEAELVYPDEIVAVKDRVIQTANQGEFDGVVRMARPVTKHVEGRLFDAENRGVEVLFEAFRHNEAFIFPGFKVYLESHAWSYFWRSASYAEYFQRDLGNGYESFRQSLPPTALVVGPSTVLWDNGERQELTVENINIDLVIKRSDSTGAENLLVIRRKSLTRGRRQEVLDFIAANHTRGLVVQRLIFGEKEKFPVYANGGISEITGNMKYSAYHAADGQYLGGNAMCCPGSYKVHGGTGTYIVPVFIL